MSMHHSASVKPKRKLRMLSATAATVALIFGSFAMGTAAHAGDEDNPVNTVAPLITGTAVVGGELTVSQGTWTDEENQSPLAYTYLWSSPTNPSLATTAVYKPKATDLGQILTASVTATETEFYGLATTVSVSTIAAIDGTKNTVAPSLSGGETVGSTLTVDPGSWTSPSEDLTYSYTWASVQGESANELDDSGITHVITADDIGSTIVVDVTVTSATDEVTARVSTSVIVPTAPFATDAGLTSANKGSLTAIQPNTTTAVVSVPGGVAGSQVYVYAYSTPTALGFFTLDANGAITVSLASLAAGEHRLLVLDASGAVIGWVSVTAGSVLAATGGEVNVPIIIGGGALVLFGLLAVLYVARQRRSNLPLNEAAQN